MGSQKCLESRKRTQLITSGCSSQQLGMFEDGWGANFHPKWEAGEHEPVPKLSAESGKHP